MLHVNHLIGFGVIAASGNTPHRYWRWNNISASGVPNASWMLTEEMEILLSGVDLIPAMTAATTSGVTISADGETTNVSWRVGDNTAAYWEVAAQTGHWLKVDFGSAVAPNAYSVKGYSGWNPVSWDFQWSDDNSAWTTIDSQTGQSTSGARIEYALPAY